MVGMVACTMLFCLAAGDFDLSVESTVALGGVLVAVIIKETGSITLGILGGLFAGTLIGLFAPTIGWKACQSLCILPIGQAHSSLRWQFARRR